MAFLTGLSPLMYKIFAAVAGIVLLFAIYFYWKHEIILSERERVTIEYEKKIQAANVLAQNELLNKNKQIAKSQELLNKAQNEITQKSRELQDATNSYNNLLQQYASGNKRLSIKPGNTRKNPVPEQDSNSRTASGVAENSTELLPELSVSILDFARRYQESVRLKNECIDLYNAAKDSVNSN